MSAKYPGGDAVDELVVLMLMLMLMLVFVVAISSALSEKKTGSVVLYPTSSVKKV